MDETFGEDDVSVSKPDSLPTRWDRLRSTRSEDDKEERGGIYLVALAVLILPLLIVLTVVFAGSDPGAEVELTEPEVTDDTGLDVVTTSSAKPRETQPVQSSEPVASTSTVVTEVQEFVVGSESLTAVDADSSTDSVDVADSDGVAPTKDSVAEPVQELTSAAAITRDLTQETSAPVPDEDSLDPPASEQFQPTIVVEPTPLVDTAPPATTTTITTTTTIAPEAPQTVRAPTEPADFAQRIDVGQLGDTYIRYRFMAATTTSYNVLVRQGSQIITRGSGTAIGGELLTLSADGLLPGTDYTLQVTLNGPPSAISPAVPFRTAGGEAPALSNEQVQVLDLRLVENGPTRFQVNYESNICANGSLVITRPGGVVVGRNSGQAAGCTTRHLGIPGFWTAALEPNMSYVITVTVEANGAGRGDGNTASQSLTVTTTG